MVKRYKAMVSFYNEKSSRQTQQHEIHVDWSHSAGDHLVDSLYLHPRPSKRPRSDRLTDTYVCLPPTS